MQIRFRSTFFLAVGLALAVAAPALGEDPSLVPKYRPGDAYALALNAATETEAVSGGSVDKRFHQLVRVEYEADVVILAVDAEGRPVRERHQDVRLDVQSSQGSGSIFEGDTSFEVHREDGEVTVFMDGRRAAPGKEKVIVQILATQFEHTLEPALLDPGRQVALGETWELDPSRAEALLRQRGIRVVELGAPATATMALRTGEDGRDALEVDYRIPISWIHPGDLFPGALAGETGGLFEGTVRLASTPNQVPVSRRSRLTLDIQGSVTNWGRTNTRPYPWTVHSSKTAEQEAVKLGTELAGTAGPALPASPAR